MLTNLSSISIFDYISSKIRENDDYLFPVKSAKHLLKQMEIKNILPTKINLDDSFAIILSLYGSGYKNYSHSIEKMIENNFNIFEEE